MAIPIKLGKKGKALLSRSAFLRTIKRGADRLLRSKEKRDSPVILGRDRQETVSRRNERVWQEFTSQLDRFDRDHVWAFTAGDDASTFSGNPKYLFAYVNIYRPDIFAYWLCSAKETVDLVRSLGFRACLLDSAQAAYAAERTGVIVVDHVIENIPFTNVKCVNLWHGIDYKNAERGAISDENDTRMETARKYIKNNSLYRDQMLITAAGPMQESFFIKNLGVESTHILRCGCARCSYQQKYKALETFNHDIKGLKGLSKDARIVAYVPNHRDEACTAFSDAFPDIEELYLHCQENNLLLIFTYFPQLEMDAGYISARKQYAGRPHFLFWDDRNDLYEIIDKIDILIYENIAIFYDFLAAGVKKYIYYPLPAGGTDNRCPSDVTDWPAPRTAGAVCHSFHALLDALDQSQKIDDPAMLEAVYQSQWSYAGDDDFEKTIQSVMDFTIVHTGRPTLYSFDIFDTLISRKGLAPTSIFHAVRERMLADGHYPEALVSRYPELRGYAETNVREYMRKSQDQRGTFHVEISLRQIHELIRDVYGLSDQQMKALMQWEIDEELAASIPLSEQIARAKALTRRGETVVLISDMYLPKEVIQRLLTKADPFLAELPLFLSNEYGVLKTSGLLYFEVYRSFKPFYDFGKWIHYGDNPKADQSSPRKMNIAPRLIRKPAFSDMESALTRTLDNPDGFLVAAMQARLQSEFRFAKSDFVIDFVALAMVPYVDWALRDAIARGYTTLFFISRDGHPLKRIADALIEVHHWPLKTKYIYSSRRAWRIPSYIDEIDVDFWSVQGGNFNDIESKEKLLHALDIDDENTFAILFPQIDLDSINFSDWSAGQPARKLVPMFQSSSDYREYLLNRAKAARESVCGYLAQEIDPAENIAFVEFWGRGYNQLCHSRLWNHVIGNEVPLPYYYARSVLPTEGNCIRYNLTTDNVPLFFMEAIFANMPYRSVESYETRGGRIEPVITPVSYDRDLFQAMENLLPEFARRYAALELREPEATDRKLFDFVLDYFNGNTDSPFIYDNIGGLVDSVAMYGSKTEYARAYELVDIERFRTGIPRERGTRSVMMSYMRSEPEFKLQYNELFQREPGSDPADGKLLTPEQLERNRLNHIKYSEGKHRAAQAAQAYTDACALSPVEDLIVVVSAESPYGGIAAAALMRSLEKTSRFAVEHVSAKRKQTEDGKLMQLLAKARFIITEGNVPQFSGLSFRAETTTISLTTQPFRLYYTGHALTHSLTWVSRYEKFLYNTRYDLIEVPGEAERLYLLQAQKANPFAVNDILGCCITDIYFDEAFRSEAKQFLLEVFPAARGRKLILYIPTPRLRAGYDDWLELLDLKRLSQLIGQEYAVAVDLRKGKGLVDACMNEIDIPGFSKRIGADMLSTRHLLSAADVVIGDYRDVFFESVLLNKPVFSTACDMEDRYRSQNLAFDFSEINPFPIVNSSEDLAKHLEHLDQYDFSPLISFRDKFLTWCDGRSAERLVDYLIRSLD